MGKADTRELLQLVQVIDEEGTNLTKSEIDFIAGIIDNKQKTFKPGEVTRIKSIHQKRVVEGEPEYD
jgi:flagellar biosynthesis/type III secretory pathway chaperone